ncbi:MAG: DUF1585 domain-containing protein [Hyalangium sp.]
MEQVPLERHLRQLSLDLLGRPPTIEEYRAYQAKGSISEDDIRQMMNSEEFYSRMRGYHRALLRTNISASVNDQFDTRLSGVGVVGPDPRDSNKQKNDPFGFRNNPSVQLRGTNGAACNAFIPQDSCNSQSEDPHAEPAVKTCRDAQGVPLPVSFDYDTNFFACTRLDSTDATITDCNAAVTKSAIQAKQLYFCDMRRLGDNKLHPHLCLPDPAKSTTNVLTQEELDANGKIVAFSYPSPPAGTKLTRLDRCTLDLQLTNGVKGSYKPQQGCLQREGYVMKPAPFFDSGLPQFAVCAIEAQERDTNPYTMESCDTARFSRDRTCGCGVGLRRCEVPNVLTARINAVNQEPERIADSVVRRDEPYFNILTTRRSFVNGTLSQLYRNQQGVGVFTITPPSNPDVIPNIPYDQVDTWVEYTRDPQHSGVLTTPEFLYRFPTERSRVNEFYESFLCKSFVPSPDPMPPPEDDCNRENNLAKRCGCKYCHATIEPTGAHWGRFDERNALFMSPSRYPRFDPKCRDCALNGDTSCGGECSQYVMTAYDGDGANSLGMLKTYLYRTADEEANIEGGPELLVQRMLQTGDLERCTVKRIWNEFLGRPMTAQEQELYLNGLSHDFASHNHSLKSLILEMLLSDAYRRID